MKRKILAILLTFIMLFGMINISNAAGTPPATISAPLYLGVADYMGSGVTCTFSAPDDLRTLLDLTDEERGYHMVLRGQIDFKIDNGDWHHTAAWDDRATYTKYALDYYNSIKGGQWKQFLGHGGIQFPSMFPDEKNAPPRDGFHSWDWYKNHSITFRARFAIDCYNNAKGIKSLVFSDWSQEYVLSDKAKMDYKKIINANAPALVSSRLEQDSKDKKPYIWLDMSKHPAETQKFNAAASDSMRTEIWMRKDGDTEFKLVGDSFFGNEAIRLDVSSYYKDSKVTDFAAAVYEVKVRYKIDERAYRQSGVTTMTWLYSPYSNTLSYGMPAWSNATKNFEGELKKAEEAGLIPDILKGQDLTKPITRAEFASVALKLYESLSQKNISPAADNTFTDTKNIDVLKAYAADIVLGTSKGTNVKFEPDKYISREQCAAMLTRVYKKLNWEGWTQEGDSTYTRHTLDYKDVKPFADDANIFQNFKPSVYFMAKFKIILGGSNNLFVPKNVPTKEDAKNYTNATREHALLFSVRTFENIDKIVDGGGE